MYCAMASTVFEEARLSMNACGYATGRAHSASTTRPGSVARRLTMTERVLLICGEEVAAYGFPDGHPFGPDRHDGLEDHGAQDRASPKRLRTYSLASSPLSSTVRGPLRT